MKTIQHDRYKNPKGDHSKWALAEHVAISGIAAVLTLGYLLYRKNKPMQTRHGLLQKPATEKDWLVKEAHHRLKNDLQMVISLLAAQAACLENPDALKAIKMCQHRIYVMSLIHQKLCQADDIRLIDMQNYIGDFVQYLNESFGSPVNIAIRLDIEPLVLGITQATPLGLIINEAITNSLKYAFPAGMKGTVNISLKQSNGISALMIADNGIGISQAPENKTTFGLQLMKGLARELRGQISFNIAGGTKISVLFKVDGHNTHLLS